MWEWPKLCILHFSRSPLVDYLFRAARGVEKWSFFSGSVVRREGASWTGSPAPQVPCSSFFIPMEAKPWKAPVQEAGKCRVRVTPGPAVPGGAKACSWPSHSLPAGLHLPLGERPSILHRRCCSPSGTRRHPAQLGAAASFSGRRCFSASTRT